ncbi:hypothetical protein Q428_04875 [Fervidicella metallireducens AeB]|uniref:Uncharacterized protein n=1 Tax=Fervidicella metallireducens AeB TaxID=1403537 RepID=A0A017RWL8_9CLOT|nr:DUF58 domain-containing protein [Fervidicella metallireducens]EYE88981.1 hypothetical protein Q428_04875 [Fervidicella metallireducens AeB]
MLYFIIFMLLSGIILNALSEKYAFKNVTFKREISKKIIEIGEELEIKISVSNKKLLPITFLQIIQNLPQNSNLKEKHINIDNEKSWREITTSVLPYQRVNRVYKDSYDKRGVVNLRDVTLKIGDLLGLKVFTKNIDFFQQIVVLPKTIDIQETIVPYGDYYGEISVKRWIIDDPVLIVGIKEYTGFEPQKDIHWPLSLKHGSLMVKKYDYTTDNKVMIILNIETDKPFHTNIDAEKIEKAISIVRAVAEELEKTGIPYGLLSNTFLIFNGESKSIIKSGWGGNHLISLLEALGRMNYGIECGFEETLKKMLSDRTNVGTYILVTPKVLKEYISDINKLKKQCERLVLISLDDTNLQLLDNDILTFVERGEDKLWI